MPLIWHFDASDLAADIVEPVSKSEYVAFVAAIGTSIESIEADVHDLNVNLDVKVHSAGATVHPTTSNTDCNALTNGKHVVYTDGSGNAPPTAGQYLIVQDYVTTESGNQVFSQLAWRFSTGLLYTRLKRNGTWTSWNKVG